MEFAVIVVIYNRSLEESETAEALARFALRSTDVLVYDNSEMDYGNAGICAARGWHYLGGLGNVGLSRAYNRCIEELDAASFRGLVCLFDDDTELAPGYFKAMADALGCGVRVCTSIYAFPLFF